MKKIYMKRIALGLAVLLILVGPVTSVADDAIVSIDREDVGSMALAYSPTVKGLELTYIQLSQDYRDYKESIEDFEELYDQFGSYQSLDAYYNAMSPNYKTWLAASAAVISDPTDTAAALALSELTDGDTDMSGDPGFPDVDGADGNSLTHSEEMALLAETEMKGVMSLADYMAYTGLKSAFSALGITGPSLSNQAEYDTFIYPIYVVPKMLQSGAMQMGVAVDQAAAGIAFGAESLYDATLMMEGYLALQALGYELALDDQEAAEKKYALGQISEVALEQAVNDAGIAELNLASMERQVKNLEMQLNVMLGQAVQTPLALVSEVGVVKDLESVDYYIERGQEDRAEMRNNEINEWYNESLIELVDKYLGDNKIEYIRADNALKDLKIEKTYEMKHIEADVRQAYMAVLQCEEDLRIKKLEKEDALRQQRDMQLNVSLGFVTETMAKGIDVLVTDASEAYYKSYRDYLAAYNALNLQSTIGQ